MRYAIALVVLGLAAGCATAQRDATCRETPMPVNVYTVGSRITVEEEIIVCRQNVQITWAIDPTQTNRYEFHADSIEIKSPDPDDEFSNCKATGGQLGNNNKEIRCHDKNNKRDGRGYLYNIRVYEIGQGIPITKDPSIVNQ
jgi:hypothetical protein